jgi:hypothetical protein
LQRPGVGAKAGRENRPSHLPVAGDAMPKAWPVEALEANMPLPHAAALILRVKLP